MSICSEKKEATKIRQFWSKRIHKTSSRIFFFTFPNASFFSLLVFLCVLILRSSRLATLDCDPFPPLLFSLRSVMKCSVGEFSAVASLKEESSFYRCMRYGAWSLEASGCDWGKGSPASLWIGRSVCNCLCMVRVKTTHTVEWCSSRHQTTGEALVNKLLSSFSSSCSSFAILHALQSPLMIDYSDFFSITLS